MKKHTKHTHLIKPQGGKYHGNEFGFIGAPCGVIQKMSKKISNRLEKQFSIGFMDAEHGKSGSSLVYPSVYTDKISHHCIEYKDEYIDYTLRQNFRNCDALLINANHFYADQQIVIINEKKKESLSRKLDKLTNVLAFVLDEGVSSPFDFLKGKVSDYSEVPIISIKDLESITRIIREYILNSIPPLNGLLLYGGKSLRMGTDKGKIKYHDIPQVDYLKKILKKHCEHTFISLAAMNENCTKEESIVDTFTGLGPYGGLLSAFRRNPNRAYFSLPCDVPFIDDELINHLIESRDPSKVATCFHNEETGFPEPLITIWEPRSYPVLLDFLSKGYSCPRKVLINNPVKEITPPSQLALYNANTPEEKLFAIEKLKQNQAFHTVK